jgi:hypothetical protein
MMPTFLVVVAEGAAGTLVAGLLSWALVSLVRMARTVSDTAETVARTVDAIDDIYQRIGAAEPRPPWAIASRQPTRLYRGKR